MLRHLLIDHGNILQKELNALTEQLVAHLQLVELLVAASNVVVHNRAVNRLDKQLSFLLLHLQNLLSLLENLNRSLEIGLG